jgi:hypothetical protein
VRQSSTVKVLVVLRSTSYVKYLVDILSITDPCTYTSFIPWPRPFEWVNHETPNYEVQSRLAVAAIRWSYPSNSGGPSNQTCCPYRVRLIDLRYRTVLVPNSSIEHNPHPQVRSCLINFQAASHLPSETSCPPSFLPSPTFSSHSFVHTFRKETSKLSCPPS